MVQGGNLASVSETSVTSAATSTTTSESSGSGDGGDTTLVIIIAAAAAGVALLFISGVAIYCVVSSKPGKLGGEISKAHSMVAMSQVGMSQAEAGIVPSAPRVGLGASDV